MKLRNKKTGEIIIKHLAIKGNNEVAKTYDSLAELNEEWEDYEEPKDMEEFYNKAVEDLIKTSEESEKVARAQKFIEQCGHLTVGDAIKLNKKERSKMRKVDWEKTIICGVSLGFMASTLYLLLVIAAQITA